MTARVLVAGVGNVFFADDGFGVEVAQRLGREPLPEGVLVADYGIRGVHLAYALLDAPALLIVVDAVSHGGVPGTLYLIEPAFDGDLLVADVDAHGMNLPAVYSTVRALGGTFPRTLVVGCEVGEVEERIGLSAPVAAAVAPALAMIREVLAKEHRASAVQAPVG